MNEHSKDQTNHVDSLLRTKWQAVSQAQHQATGWLFSVHGAGIAGTLTYASAKISSKGIQAAFVLFALGLTAIVLYSAFLYYLEDRYLHEFRKDAAEYYGGHMDWEALTRRENSRPKKYSFCEILVWSSGILGLGGLVCTAIAIF